jgi:hypothetical protein
LPEGIGVEFNFDIRISASNAVTTFFRLSGQLPLERVNHRMVVAADAEDAAMIRPAAKSRNRDWKKRAERIFMGCK